MKSIIERTEYLEWLKRWKDKQIIKVVSGVRRCGKSTLFEIYKEYLLSTGVNAKQIISINFEDYDFEELNTAKALYAYVKSLLQKDKMNYIFLDEVQHCKEFEKVVDSLFIKDNCDVYITGSNAYFMSSELSTLLSGRYIEIEMLPLSFSEFVNSLESPYDALSNREKFNLYIYYSSFPFIAKYNSFSDDSKDYLKGIFDTILYKDVAGRLNVADTTSLENVARFILYSIGNKISPTKISNTLKSSGKSIDQKTVDKYLKGLKESMLIYEASRFNIKGKQYLSTQSKYYAVDVGLRNLLVKTRESDIGHILENIVYLELKRRYKSVYVGETDFGEVDFVTVNGNDYEYFQVSATTLDENTLRREL
ncbi:MAG: ATP-binding protein, partial [Eubacterium sp.]|nr:ATP-binding protein [Eubacterium sp.]